jgi:hypothetical protein
MIFEGTAAAVDIGWSGIQKAGWQNQGIAS